MTHAFAPIWLLTLMGVATFAFGLFIGYISRGKDAQ